MAAERRIAEHPPDKGDQVRNAFCLEKRLLHRVK
jgi:hypothetical protein